MEVINLKIEQRKTAYPIIIGAGVLKRLPEIIKKISSTKQLIIITDNRVKKLYANSVSAFLNKIGYKCLILSVPASETSKSEREKNRLQLIMLKKYFSRDTIILALGGGVVGDLAGFVAATYMRGIPYIQIPTTLLAMVDSSIGGKTGINTAQGKNLIGAIWQPKAVIADTNFLRSLPQKQLINGIVEAVKMSITNDISAFNFVEKNFKGILKKKQNLLEKIIARAIKIKAGVVGRDEKESGERMVLNFGHTVGHALEKLSGFKMTHGQAVALGILAESNLSFNLGLLPKSDLIRINKFFQVLGFDEKILGKWNAKKILEQTKFDKKNTDGAIRCVLIKRIGNVYVKQKSFAQKINDINIIKSLETIHLALTT